MPMLFKLLMTFLILCFSVSMYGFATVGNAGHQKIANVLLFVFAICTVLSAIGLVWSL